MKDNEKLKSLTEWLIKQNGMCYQSVLDRIDAGNDWYETKRYVDSQRSGLTKVGNVPKWIHEFKCISDKMWSLNK